MLALHELKRKLITSQLNYFPSYELWPICVKDSLSMNNFSVVLDDETSKWKRTKRDTLTWKEGESNIIANVLSDEARSVA